MLLVSFFVVSSAAVVASDSPSASLDKIRNRLVRQFDDLLSDPDHYKRLVISEAYSFPEGNLFPFVLPGYAYTNLGLDSPAT